MNTSRFPLAAIGVLVLALAAPVGFGAQNRQDQVRPDAAGPAPESPAAHRPAVQFTRGAVTAGHPLASMAGLRIQLEGGNAADSAVATLSTLHVVRPQSSGTGGNGFFTIYDKATDRVYSLAASGAAARALDPTTMTRETLNRGIHAGVVPGLFGGWIALLDRFGTMSLAEVLEPAIDYAETGHPIEESVSRSIARSQALFEQHPTSASVFLPGGYVPEPGDLFRMTDLATTFKKVVEAEQEAIRAGKSRSEALQAAFDRFYKGDVAQELAGFYQEHGGDFTMEDFAAYEPIWQAPLHSTFRGYDIYTSPSTSRGGFEVAIQLNLVEGFDLKALGHNSPATLHLLAEAIKLAKADVYHYVADEKFTDIPVAGLLSKDYAALRRSLITERMAMGYPEAGQPRPVVSGGPGEIAALEGPQFDEHAEVGGTTSFSIVDQFGNVIAATPTHGGGFGTGVVVGNTGLLFNNGTRIGSTSPYPDDVNYVRGGQIPPTEQLADHRDAGRRVCPGHRLSRRRNHWPDTIPGGAERPGVWNVDSGGGGGAAVRPHRRTEFLPTGRRDSIRRREPHRSGNCARADRDGARCGSGCAVQLREQQRDPARRDDGDAVGRRRSAPRRIRRGLVARTSRCPAAAAAAPARRAFHSTAAARRLSARVDRHSSLPARSRCGPQGSTPPRRRLRDPHQRGTKLIQREPGVPITPTPCS